MGTYKIETAFEGLEDKESDYTSGTGKIVTPKPRHGYLKTYENNFNAAIDREKVTSFCELGISRGASLIAWKRYFPNAKIIGIDNREKTLYPLKGPSFYEVSEKFLGDQSKDISIEIGDAFDKDFLKSVAKKHGGFDIVLDDCSHIGKQMRLSFEALWQHTRFLYTIEDLHTQFANGIAKGHLAFSRDKNYSQEENFITDYLQQLVVETIEPINIQNKTQFSTTIKNISHIITEHFMVFIYRKR